MITAEKFSASVESRIKEYNTLKKIVANLDMLNYEALGHPLKSNPAYIALQRMAEAEISEFALSDEDRIGIQKYLAAHSYNPLREENEKT